MVTVIKGDIWELHSSNPIVVTTNLNVKKDGTAVMGKGIALQAAQRFPGLPRKLGLAIQNGQKGVIYFREYNLITFPTKYNWWDKSDLDLIRESTEEISHLGSALFSYMYDINTIYMVKPGCSNGQLSWDDVRPIIEEKLDNRYVIIDK